MPDYIEEVTSDGTDAFLSQGWFSKESKKVKGFMKWEDDAPLRIGILGAHGVGKSTLAKRLSLELGLLRIDEVARTLHGLGFKLDTQTTMQTQSLMWLGQFYEELTHEEFVSDRTLIDVLAYTEAHNRILKNKKNNYFISALANVTYEIIESQYTALFYVPIEFKLHDDGVRNTDPEFQRQINDLILYYLNSFNVDYFPITGSRDKRLTSAIKYLNQTGLLDGPKKNFRGTS